ncbi:hypothetical protein [Pendulispora albinea]|uniref:PEGA domain-containing protein n=1 Tax=Pendulispora albinea TaxID=2741071 RepID=A0ABZ2LV62_9BACT
MRARRGRLLEACIVVVVTGQTNAAFAVDKAACIDAHEHGQEARLAGKWMEARALFLQCAQSSCPAPLVKDCTEWSGELERQIPTVVVETKRPDGVDTDDAAFFVDGAQRASRVPSTPLALDPGAHTLRVEHAGWSPAETTVILRDGDRERRVVLQLTSPVRPRTGRETLGAVPTSRGATSSIPVAAWVGAGATAALAGVSVLFLVRGKTREQDLAASPCGVTGTCTDAEVDPIRTDYMVSGVAAAAAAVALGITIWQLVAHRPAAGMTAALPKVTAATPLRLTF